ncbi:PP2C family protein-serine/threonine phosphatase [Naasia sp. SYSU D00057]|uniref:PP2C family protein-serine/threonine phosphatase n=1 Tax=Naasia sp. SYSU D00057 TaxID=2817380 RepID=UPI001B306861|nr:SpoIIE family protein phosphatase [Naasia sp. SYSU D00057]
MTLQDSEVRLDDAEERRLEALHELNILDTPPDERFDLLTRVTQQLFQVPMVSLTLIDRDRQWRKSFQGPLEREAPRSGSFCGQAVERNARLIVPDASADPEFESNPFVAGDPHLRFYAGHPLKAPSGEPIGTFCIMDTNPRVLTPSESALLQDLSALVQAELARDSELDRAAEVQRSLLPRRAPDLPGFEFAAHCEPSRGIGGDFFDWHHAGEDVAVTVADVMGKGLGAAILAAGVRSMLRGASTYNEPGAALTRAAAALEEDLAESASFVTVFHARIAADGGVLFADAGHGLSMIVRASGAIDPLLSPDPPFGLLPGLAFEELSTRLEPGDALMVCSDGLTDALGGPAEALERARHLLAVEASAQQTVDRLRRLLPPGPTDDDVTVLVVKRSAR